MFEYKIIEDPVVGKELEKKFARRERKHARTSRRSRPTTLVGGASKKNKR